MFSLLLDLGSKDKLSSYIWGGRERKAAKEGKGDRVKAPTQKGSQVSQSYLRVGITVP